MNRHFTAFIDLGKTLAQEKGLTWDFPIDDSGNALDGIGWNLTHAVNDVAPSAQYLRDLGVDTKVLEHINPERISNGLPRATKRPLSPAWIDLIKAAVSEQLFYRRNTPAHALSNIARPLKVMASCVDAEPWAMTADQLGRAIEIGKELQASGKLGMNMVAIVKNLFDENHLFDSGPLFAMIKSHRQQYQSSVKSKHTMSDDELRARLEDRKREEKLPGKRAFWELTRIVFTEQPRTFSDELKFAAVKTMILTGLRIGEVALLPVDWKRERHYFDASGRPAAASGGMSSGMSIRHFAEKQQVEMSDSRILRQGNQYVPEMFREILSDSLDRIENITKPLRKTIQMQFESGRLLPWYRDDELIRFTEIYTRLSGNPFWLKIDRDSFLTRYRNQFDPAVLYELDKFQNEIYRDKPSSLDSAIYVFGHRLLTKMRNGETSLRFRSADGSIIDPMRGMAWAKSFLYAGELEQYLREKLPTKVSDLAAMPTDSGSLAPWQFLFLHPKRSLAEERNGGICDVTKYAAIGRPDSVFIASAVGDHPSMPSLFQDYASSESDRALSLTSHTLRHLQNTELFRLGIADTIISKRYNRRSVAQSYEYDHRSLAEELESIDLPEDIEAMLGPKASTVTKMILAGKASGPIVDAFKRIQAEDGDIAAFEYLRVEADGFHATPYGHCLNSFTVDPCPKHLECFAGCRHLSATDLPENRGNLMRLEEKFKAAIITIKSRPSSSIGWSNQLEHAEKRLSGVQALLTTKPGELVFPNGPDFSTDKQASLFDS